MRVRGVLLVALVLLCPVVLFCTGPSWSYKHGQEIKWFRVSRSGDVIAGSDGSIFCINPENGQNKWRRDDLQGIGSFQAEEVEGTPFLIVKDPDYVVDEETGRLFDRRGDTIVDYSVR